MSIVADPAVEACFQEAQPAWWDSRANRIRIAKTISWNSIGICITTLLVGASSGSFAHTFLLALPTVMGLAIVYFFYDGLWDRVRGHDNLPAKALIVRGLGWRLIVTSAIGTLALVLHGSLASVTMVALLHAVLNTTLEILHEGVWDRIRK